MVECEVCMEKFPIDCFEFFPCAHKLCQFCYHNIKQLKCPYCRLDLEPRSDVDDPDYDPDYYIIPELPATNRNHRRNRRRNRRNAQRNSNNELMFDDLSNVSAVSNVSNVSNVSTESTESNQTNSSNVNSRRNRNNLRNTTERFSIITTGTTSTSNTSVTRFTSVNNNHFSLLSD